LERKGAAPQREGFGTKLIAQRAKSLSRKLFSNFRLMDFIFLRFSLSLQQNALRATALPEQHAFPNIVRPLTPGHGADGDGMA
jgi:hypothetical protein